MPSGPKKRKASKKTKPGDPHSSYAELPELETGLDDGTAEEMEEGSPSPMATEGDPEDMADQGLEGKQINEKFVKGGAVRDEIKEGFQTEEAFAPDCSKGDPPPQEEPELQIPDSSLDEIKPEVKSAPVERESEPDAAPIGSGLGTDELPVETAPDTIKPEIDDTPVETKAETDSALADIQPEIDEASVEMEAETYAAPAYIEPETDEASVEIKPGTDGATADIQPDTVEALVEREPTPADVEPEMDASPADTEAKADIAQVEMDASPVEIQPHIDAAGPGTETETDAAACEIETEINTAQVEIEPGKNAALPEMEAETEAAPIDIKSEANTALIDIKQDELAQAEMESEPEQEVEALVELPPELEAENLDASLEIEAETGPPQDIDREPEDLSEDTSSGIGAKTEALQEIEPEPGVEAVGKGKPDNEDLVGIKAEEKRFTENELDQQDLVEGEVVAPLGTNPEPEVGASQEREGEAELTLEAGQKPEAEALAADKSDEKGFIETESDQQDLAEIEPDQTDVYEHDQQPQQQERGAAIGESISGDNQSQQQPVDALELPVIEDELSDHIELPAVSASDEAISVDDSISSIPVVETSINADNEGPVNEQELLGKLDKGEDVPPSAVAFEGEGEGTEEGISDDQNCGVDLEQRRETAVDNKQGVVDDELADESKEDTDGQERAVDDGHDKDQTALTSVGDGNETVVPREQELAIELPSVDAVDVQERAMQETLLKDQELVSEKSRPSIDEQEPRVESELVEQGSNTTLPSSESEMILDPFEFRDEGVPSADDEKLAYKHEFNLDSPSGELERDIGEEEGASSTVAEAGSVLNDFYENVPCEHGLQTDFPATEYIPDIRDFDDTLSAKVPELVGTGLEEQLDSELSPTEQQRSITKSNRNEVEPLASEGDLLTDKADLKARQGLGNSSKQEEVLLESAEAAESAEQSQASLAEEVPDDVQPLSEQVVQHSGEDQVCLSKEGMAADEELKLVEEERAACEDGKGAAISALGVDSATESSTLAENGLTSKALTTEVDRQRSLSRSEASSNDLLDLRDISSIHSSELNNMDEAEIHAAEAKDSKEAENNSMGGGHSNDTNDAVAQSVSSTPEGGDVEGVQAFRQKRTQEASLPVVVPAQDRALEHVNLNSIEHPRGGATLERRKNWLGCCGMFDLLLRKN